MAKARDLMSKVKFRFNQDHKKPSHRGHETMTFRKMGVGGAEEWHQVMSPDEAGCHHRTDGITPRAGARA